MELGFIEGLRRRWDVLGIQQNQDEKGKEKALEMPLELGIEEAAATAKHMRLDNAADMVVDEADATRKAIMDGAIVKSVISSATKGTFLALTGPDCTMEIFLTLFSSARKD